MNFVNLYRVKTILPYKSTSYPRISEWEYFISNNSKCDLLFITIMYFCELWRFAITFYIWKYTLPFDILSLISIWTHKTQLLVCIFILFNFVSTILDPNRAGMQIKHTGNTSYYKDLSFSCQEHKNQILDNKILLRCTTWNKIYFVWWAFKNERYI